MPEKVSKTLKKLSASAHLQTRAAGASPGQAQFGRVMTEAKWG